MSRSVQRKHQTSISAVFQLLSPGQHLELGNDRFFVHLLSLDETDTTLGNRIHVQHRNARTLPVEGSAHDDGRTMVRAEYGNTEGSPNPSG
jgi:hypothetical protein